MSDEPSSRFVSIQDRQTIQNDENERNDQEGEPKPNHHVHLGKHWIHRENADNVQRLNFAVEAHYRKSTYLFGLLLKEMVISFYYKVSCMKIYRT